DIRLIESADTFFLGTTHPEAGNDASHRGGPAGFVRVTDERLWWPDYPGNNMFNSFGNLAVDPTAALLFVDFRTGDTLQLSGTATVDWAAPAEDHDDQTGRRVLFTPRQVVATAIPDLTSPARAGQHE
nr:pyridoxamine 5'-phosphate oxidase family protein [Mycobacterium sp.]